jgi:cytochrome c biogenesis protein CcmG/thiol:disulfide interchange protein DsbE
LAVIVVGVVALVAAVLVVVLVASGGSDADSAAPRSAGRNAGVNGTIVEPGPAEVGAAAPDFVLPGLDGESVALADFAGKPTVVNFWASWCHPCRKEFPLLKAARAKHARDGLEVIGVSYRDIASDGRAFVADQGADWAFARDPDGKLAAAYGVRAVPQTFFVDADGTVVSRVFGITSAQDLEAEIQKILPGAR